MEIAYVHFSVLIKMANDKQLIALKCLCVCVFFGEGLNFILKYTVFQKALNQEHKIIYS